GISGRVLGQTRAALSGACPKETRALAHLRGCHQARVQARRRPLAELREIPRTLFGEAGAVRKSLRLRRVATVCDRRTTNGLLNSGGHRPPLYLKSKKPAFVSESGFVRKET